MCKSLFIVDILSRSAIGDESPMSSSRRQEHEEVARNWHNWKEYSDSRNEKESSDVSVEYFGVRSIEY